MSVEIVIDRPTGWSNWDTELAPSRSITTSLMKPKKADSGLVGFLIVFVAVAVVCLGFGVWYTWVFLGD
jgi:fatty acid desaturase